MTDQPNDRDVKDALEKLEIRRRLGNLSPSERIELDRMVEEARSESIFAHIFAVVWFVISMAFLFSIATGWPFIAARWINDHAAEILITGTVAYGLVSVVGAILRKSRKGEPS